MVYGWMKCIGMWCLAGRGVWARGQANSYGGIRHVVVQVGAK